MAKHCPICNKSSAEIKFYGEFCQECASRRLSERLPGEAEVQKCRVCGRIRTREGLKEEDRSSLRSVLTSRLKNYRVQIIDFSEGSAKADVTEEGPGQLSTEKTIKINYRKMTCEQCYKKIGGYYEAVLQLRGDEERIRRFIERITRYVEVRDGFISDVKKVEGGYDVYASSKSIVNAFISEREIPSTKSFTLSGLNKSGKREYKNTYAIRI